jgi:hypothetical protein
MKTVPTAVVRRLPAVVLLTLLWAGNAIAEPSNKWRIEFSGGARSNGAIVLRVTPVGGTGTDVEILIPADAGENRVASLVRDGLYAALGKGYHVERDDGEDVLVKRRRPTPDFDLVLVSNSVEGVRMRLQHE